MWPKFHTHITTYMKVGKNEFDDAPDALTGTVERRGEKKTVSKKQKIYYQD